MNRIDKPLNFLKKYWWLFLVIALLLVILDSFNRGLDWSNWAKSAKPPGPGAITLWGRTLWDWADLLLVPLVLAIGGFLFQRSERKTDREIADKRHTIDQQIAKEARMDKTLDEYLKAMTSFLLQEKSLLKSKKDEPIRKVARTQTISVIKRLDSERNQIVFQFLQEANLISVIKGDETEEADNPIISLARADLRLANLEEVNLHEAKLFGTNLQEASLTRANLTKADLTKANLQNADLTWANLQEANLQEAKLTEAKLTRAFLQKANLLWADLLNADLEKAFLIRANLEEVYLLGADLSGASLEEAYLKNADLAWADLTKADLTRADLQNANLFGTNLTEANLTEANLTEANLTKANLTEANLEGAIITDISSIRREGYFHETTMPDGTIFSESTDLKKFTEPTEEE